MKIWKEDHIKAWQQLSLIMLMLEGRPLANMWNGSNELMLKFILTLMVRYWLMIHAVYGRSLQKPADNHPTVMCFM